jgi:hypothetical protein
MRRKKHKHTRRTVAFYRLSYGFHEPFKVVSHHRACYSN